MRRDQLSSDPFQTSPSADGDQFGRSIDRTMDKVTEQPITLTGTSPLCIDANVANYGPEVKAVVPGSPVTAPASSPERNLLRMRSDLSEASSVMVEEASERSGKRERERGRRRERERERKFLVWLGQEGWGPLHLSHAAGRGR